MKRILAILFACALFLACVPTPETDVVIKKAETNPIETVPDDLLKETLAAVPSSWNTSFSMRDGTVNVFVDAAVEIPDVDRFPMVEVRPAAIDAQTAAKLLYKLIPNGTIRISDHGGQAYSTEDVDLWIEEVKKQLAHTDEIAFASDQERDAYIEAQNAELKRLFDMRESAVSGKVVLLKDYELLGRYGTMECRILDADGKECANLLWKPQSADCNDKRESALHIDSFTTACSLLDHGVQSREEAMESADRLVAEIGLDDRYTCVSVRESVNSISCYYAQQYKDIPSTPLTATLVGDNGYSTPWPNEMLLISFQKHEGRTNVIYVCPSEIVEECGDAKLLAYKEVMTQFEKSMKASYSWFEETTASADITVDRITLGYDRVPMYNKPNRYVWIPAWTFRGTRTTYEIGDDGSAFENRNELPNDVLLILSAIDGSILYAG